MMTRGGALLLAVLLMGGTWLVSRSLSQAELVVPTQPLVVFPLTIEGRHGQGVRWEGRDLSMEADVLKILKLSDYVLRVYLPRPARSGPVALPAADPTPVWLYVGYYQSQRTGATYHSPKNCLPGAGWQFAESTEVTLPVPGGGPVTINRVLIEKGLDRQIILYWYQDRGRVIASEYWAKGYLMWDAMTNHRTDGALVRISVPVRSTPEEAYEQGIAFLLDVWPLLRAALPA